MAENKRYCMECDKDNPDVPKNYWDKVVQWDTEDYCSRRCNINRYERCNKCRYMALLNTKPVKRCNDCWRVRNERIGKQFRKSEKKKMRKAQAQCRFREPY